MHDARSGHPFSCLSPQTHHVRGSNYNLINVFEDRIPGRAIVLSGGHPSQPLASPHWSGPCRAVRPRRCQPEGPPPGMAPPPPPAVPALPRSPTARGHTWRQPLVAVCPPASLAPAAAADGTQPAAPTPAPLSGHPHGCCTSLERPPLQPPHTHTHITPMPAAVIDNLVKGASGQAIQNMNLLWGLPEETALLQQALFP